MTVFIDYLILMRSLRFSHLRTGLLGIKILCLPSYPKPILFIKLWKAIVTRWPRYFDLWSKYTSHFLYNLSAHLVVYFHGWKQRCNFMHRMIIGPLRQS